MEPARAMEPRALGGANGLCDHRNTTELRRGATSLRIATQNWRQRSGWRHESHWRGPCISPSMSNGKQDKLDLSSLTQLRDEIRVRLHLAQLDAKDKWQEIETQLAGLEHRVASEGGSVMDATEQLAKELKQALVDFRQRLSS